jgi:hypothetical protein
MAMDYSSSRSGTLRTGGIQDRTNRAIACVRSLPDGSVNGTYLVRNHFAMTDIDRKGKYIAMIRIQN